MKSSPIFTLPKAVSAKIVASVEAAMKIFRRLRLHARLDIPWEHLAEVESVCPSAAPLKRISGTLARTSSSIPPALAQDLQHSQEMRRPSSTLPPCASRSGHAAQVEVKQARLVSTVSKKGCPLLDDVSYRRVTGLRRQPNHSVNP